MSAFVCMCCAFNSGFDPSGPPCGYFVSEDISRHKKPLAETVPAELIYQEMIRGSFVCSFCEANVSAVFSFTN